MKKGEVGIKFQNKKDQDADQNHSDWDFFFVIFLFLFFCCVFAIIWWDIGGKGDGVGVEHGSQNSSWSEA